MMNKSSLGSSLNLEMALSLNEIPSEAIGIAAAGVCNVPIVAKVFERC